MGVARRTSCAGTRTGQVTAASTAAASTREWAGSAGSFDQFTGNKVIVEESKDDPEDYDDDDDNFGKEDLGQTPIQPIDFEKDPEYVADPDAGKDNKKRSRPLIKPVYFGNTRDPGPEVDEVASGEPSRLQQNEDYSTQRVWEM